MDIKDKRRFNVDGTIRDDESEAPPEGNETESKTGGQKTASTEAVKKPSPEEFEINFSTFVLSLASSVQINLGLIPHPATNKPELNLTSAKQTIDILGMLDEKTKGNLNPNEDRLFKQVLFELRMQYVSAVNQSKEDGKH